MGISVNIIECTYLFFLNNEKGFRLPTKERSKQNQNQHKQLHTQKNKKLKPTHTPTNWAHRTKTPGFEKTTNQQQNSNQTHH